MVGFTHRTEQAEADVTHVDRGLMFLRDSQGLQHTPGCAGRPDTELEEDVIQDELNCSANTDMNTTHTT